MKDKPLLLFLCYCFLCGVYGCGNANNQAIVADSIYFGGEILTMEGDEPTYAEAIAVKDGKIILVGSKVDVFKKAGDSTNYHDLQGRTLMPGFIDSHSHIASMSSLWKTVNLFPPPVGPVSSIDELQQTVIKYIQDHQIPEGTAVFGNGYDDALINQHRHPTQQELDAISNQHPIILLHASGHMACANSLAFQRLNITEANAKIAGGKFQLDSKTKKLNGVVEEQAVFVLFKLFPQPSDIEADKKFEEVIHYYLANGITTAQEGQTTIRQVPQLLRFIRSNKLPLDIISYPKWTDYDSIVAAFGFKIGEYNNHFKIGGVKITEDGSPQARTAFMSKPYYKVPEGYDENYTGYPILPFEEFNSFIDRFYAEGIQALVHCNGDSAAAWFLQSTSVAEKKYGKKDLRYCVIHGQAMRKDQMDEAKKLGMFLSLFPSHTFYWGDWHRQVTFGAERAANISATGYAHTIGIPFGIHTDAPVIPVSQLDALYRAVNRTTRSDLVLGPEERVSHYVGLQALTSMPAWLYFEEESKGSLKEGKLADMIILDKNPLKVDPEVIKNIQVLETIKEGRTVYQKKTNEKIQFAPFAGV